MEQAPLFDDIADGPEGGVAHWLKTDDGLKIRVGSWPVATAKGTVLLFPGRTEYVEKYGRAARDFHARGYAMLAVDWRGQGLADRMTEDATKGHVGKFTDYQHDVDATIDHARALGLPEPYYLVAHSMGGGIGLRSLIENMPVKAAAFSGPMWGIAMADLMRPVAWALPRLARPFGLLDLRAPMTDTEPYALTAALDDNTLTRDSDMMLYMRNHIVAQPDLIVSGPTLHWVDEALTETRALASLPSPDLPCFCAYGSNERIVDVNAIKLRMAKWRDGALKSYTDGEHELMMEIPATRADFFDRCTTLFDAHR